MADSNRTSHAYLWSCNLHGQLVGHRYSSLQTQLKQLDFSKFKLDQTVSRSVHESHLDLHKIPDLDYRY